jgi:hypothetical protein
MRYWTVYEAFGSYDYYAPRVIYRELSTVDNNFAKPKRLKSTDSKQKIKRASRRQGKRETKIQLNEFYEEKTLN